MVKSRSACSLLSCSELVVPCAIRSNAPGSVGTRPKSTRAPTSPAAARVISERCPASPKPVTSVQAVAPCLRKTSTASELEQSIASTAATKSAARVRPCMAPANRAPVPIGLVRIIRSPAPKPPLVNGSALSVPVTLNAMPSSAPSAEWPPTRSTPCSRKTASAPDIIWNRSSSMSASAIAGTVASANAKPGLAPIANRSFSAWWAPMRPNRYGSSIMARNPSQLTAMSPATMRIKAASSPMPRTVAGDVTTASRSRTRRRMSAPSLAPQPPQRIVSGSSPLSCDATFGTS